MSKATQDGTIYNKSNNDAFSEVLVKHISRRSMLKTGLGAAGFSLFSGIGLTGCFSSSDTHPTPTPMPKLTLGFDSIAGAKTDGVVIANGYSAQVLAPWGTPLNDMAQEWQSDGSNTALDQANSIGQNHDGMYFYPLNESSTDGLLCINHEYIQQAALHPNGASVDPISGLRNSAEEIRKEINAHGISVVRIQIIDGLWQVVKNDEHNRRFTSASEMMIAGPLSGHTELVTPFSPTGESTRGTSNNCGNGFTPWGTYLTCEENWPGYFVNKGELSEQQQRIGISTRGGRYGWEDLAGDESEQESEFARFNITPTGNNSLEDYRNEANGYGYIVEIDPHDPQSLAVKRTALGRFRHEGCAYGKVEEGKAIVFYSGHDARFEYIYKFVSEALWDPADADRSDRLTVGAKYMDQGILYVARFSEDGVGHWLALTLDGETKTGATLGEHFNSLADIILNTAGAADLVGATPMDRPEWTTVDPISGTVYLTLTNNTKRDEADIANPRVNNKFGHIIRWNDSQASHEFNWDIFVFGSPSDGADDTNLSGLTASNEFACPDGLAFDARGILWVQTDNSGAMEVKDKTNDQMLAVIPTNLVDGSGEADIIHGDNQAELRRFLVGPNGCEITGLTFTPDQKNGFLNVQHPRNWPYSMDATAETPEGQTVRPRSATVIIRKDDGGEIGI